MLNRAAPALTITAAQRSALTTLSNSAQAPTKQAIRARALLLAADGVANERIAAELQLSPGTVRSWRSRFAEEGLAQLGRVRPGQGTKPTIPVETVEAIVWATTHSTPKGREHWSCDSMATEFGVSPATVYRIWRSRGLKPHLTVPARQPRRTSRPTVDEDITDVVGLFVSPSERALALCLNDQSRRYSAATTPPVARPQQSAAEPSSGRRNGTFTLFAALGGMLRADSTAGDSTGRGRPLRRRKDLLTFLATIDREVPGGLAIHLVLDDESLHDRPELQRWLATHPRFHVLCTPSRGSWLPHAEGWCGKLAEAAPRGSLNSVPALISAIDEHTSINPDLARFVWTASTDSILARTSSAATSGAAISRRAG